MSASRRNNASDHDARRIAAAFDGYFAFFYAWRFT
jgi:hypothetical protein